MMEDLTSEQKMTLRWQLIQSAVDLLGIKYEYGAEWVDFSKIPESLDCSEMMEGVYTISKLKMWDGSQNQYNNFLPISNDQAQIGDLAFFGRGGNPSKIYHVGMLFSQRFIIECRGFQPNCSFRTGETILRPKIKWEQYRNFAGYRVHSKLA